MLEGDDVHVVDQQLHPLLQLAEGRRADGLDVAHYLFVLRRRKHLELVRQPQLLRKGYLLLVLVVQPLRLFHLLRLLGPLGLLGLRQFGRLGDCGNGLGKDILRRGERCSGCRCGWRVFFCVSGELLAFWRGMEGK